MPNLGCRPGPLVLNIATSPAMTQARATSTCKATKAKKRDESEGMTIPATVVVLSAIGSRFHTAKRAGIFLLPSEGDNAVERADLERREYMLTRLKCHCMRPGQLRLNHRANSKNELPA